MLPQSRKHATLGLSITLLMKPARRPFMTTLALLLLVGAAVSLLVAGITPLVTRSVPTMAVGMRRTSSKLDLKPNGWVQVASDYTSIIPGAEAESARMTSLINQQWLAKVDQSLVMRVTADLQMYSTFPMDHTAFMYQNVGNPIDTMYVVQEVWSGWPFRCATGVRRGLWKGATETLWAFEVPDAINRNGEAGGKLLFFGAVPFRPIWSGLAANAVIYACVLGLFFPAWSSLVRRHRRRRRNHCPACNYDRKGLATDAPCPECGTGTPESPVPDV